MGQYQIAVVVGSLRRDSFNRKLADALIKLAPPEFTFKYLTISDLPLYNQDDDENQAESIKRLKAEIAGAQGLLFVTPEYNHGYPGSLKSMLDLLLKEYIHKAVAFVGVSAGPWGGTRVIEACVPMVRELGLAVTFSDLNFPLIKGKFDEDGNLLDPGFQKSIDVFIKEFIWLAEKIVDEKIAA